MTPKLNQLKGVVALVFLLVPCRVSAQDNSPAAPIVAEASVDKAVATTGDIIEYTITIKYPDTIDVSIPEQGSEIAGFRIIDFGRHKPTTEGTLNVVSLWYKLRGDLVGSYILPKTTIPYRVKDSREPKPQTIETSEIFVEIQSVLPQDGTATDIRDLKPLRKIERPTPLWVWGALTAVVIAILAWFFWRRNKILASVEPPPIPPHDQAYAALNALRETDFSDPERIRHYFFALSEVLRTYIEGRFSMNATDLTTEELLPQIRTELPIPSELKDQLANFLSRCDGVKFAGVSATESDIEQVYESALSFVEATVPTPSPTEEAS